ncbi:MAG: Ig-like domain-containing protein [Deltaproteobacteria bacterium]|nr:Ig-like domain-containing protein [Deltaproteobacteria bacterium]
MAVAMGVALFSGCWSTLEDEEANAQGQDDSGPSLVAGPSEFADDLVPPDPASNDMNATTAMSAASPEEFVQAPGDSGTGGPPKVFYLAYADGTALPRTNPNPCQGKAPKFVCTFASTLEECQRQIQGYLDKWYADYNVIFTLKRPTSGAFYTEVISSGGGAWCDAASNVAGLAPFLCEDLAGGVAYTFLGGKNAKETAIIIAQEQAHLVGLEHTLSTRDIMDPTICPNCDGFEDVENKIHNDHCNRSRQNSHQMMKDRMGVWTGGIKPTPFGCQPDIAPPRAQILSPSDNAAVGTNFVLRAQASDQCKVSHVTVSVMPMGLHSQSNAAPFEWTLTKISGRQTITVTAFDTSGKQHATSITVRAGNAGGGTGGVGGPGGPDGGAGGSAGEPLGMEPAEITKDAEAGCQVAGCGVGGNATGGDAVAWSGAIAMALGFLALLLRGRSAASSRAPVRASRRHPRR